MLLKNLKINAFLLSLLAIVFISCEDDDPKVEKPEVTTGAFILNSGTYSDNNTSLSYYDFTTGNVTANVFGSQNSEKKLGDTGNDMIIYGSKIYYAISGSAKIVVTNRKGVLIGEGIQSKKGNYLQEPRHFAAFEGKLYVTYFDGYLAKIDTSTLQIEAQVKVGRNPEQVAVTNNKLYVANSGGLEFPANYDKTISVIDIKTFSLLKTINVAENPTKVFVDSQGDVYVASNDYSGNGALYKIDSKTDQATKIDGYNWISNMAIHNDKMYIIQTMYDEFWNMRNTYSVFDTKNEKSISDAFITGEINIIAPGTISVDPISENVYIGDSGDYRSNGDIYIYSPQGKQLKKMDSAGISPVKICFVSE